MKRYVFPALIGALVFLFPLSLPGQQSDVADLWEAALAIPDESDGARAITFGLEIRHENNRLSGTVINGDERIEIPEVTFDGSSGEIRFPHYDSVIAYEFDPDARQLKGVWRKRRGLQRWSEMEFLAVPKGEKVVDAPDEFLGRWTVKFESSSDPAVGIFSRAVTDNEPDSADGHRTADVLRGTFLTTTGDYRFLDGYVVDSRMVLCCFDGAHAFRFEATADGDGGIDGEFWSSDSWHETWTATRDEDAALADAFQQTTTGEGRLDDFQFPDFDGTLTSINDPKFAGKARLIYVFGSWCPNCHDAAAYFAELTEKYGDQGLSILGLAFEHTGDFERDAEQVRLYLERHGIGYPVLLAGTSDKADASEAFSLIDRVRSYPTTLFVDQQGNVRAIHTGFTGPATGEAYVELKSKFESLIEDMLKE